MRTRIHSVAPAAALVAALVAAQMVTVAPAHAVPGTKLQREEKSSIPAAGKTSLSVKNARGRTVIVGRADAKEVSVVANKTVVGRDGDDAKQMLDRLTMNVSEHGGEIVIETRDDNSKSDHDGWSVSLFHIVKGWRQNSWIDYTIEVPYSFDVSAAATSGEVRVSNIGGKAEIVATSGDVNIRGVGGDVATHLTSGDLQLVDVGGNLSVAATSGNVTVDNVKGRLDVDGTSGDFHASRIAGGAAIQLVSGDMTLDGCSGDVTFRASSGDARMTEVDGSVDASSSSGDIDVSIIPVGERMFRLSSSSGDIGIHYLAVRNYGFKLDARTSSGSIDGDMPIRLSRVDRRRLQGVVGSGNAHLEIETASGDITIEERDEAASKSDR